MISLILSVSILVEAESFDNVGGWVTDSASVRQMGSAYLMAHGYGRPVADATTRVSVPEAGAYSVWVRTRNWNAEWSKAPAGLFQVRVGAFTSRELGGGNRAWTWEKVGETPLPKGPVPVALHDLTGFNGRCDAIFLTTDPQAKPERSARCIAPEDLGRLVVEILETPDHLAVPDLTVQPMIQDIVPM